MPEARRALVLTAHGTASPAGRQVVLDLVAAVQQALQQRATVLVTDAYVDVQTPEVADVVADLVTRVDDVVVVPLLFCGGYHVRVDVARAVEPFASAHSTGALGPSPLIADALAMRLREAGVTQDEAVVLAAAGSSRVEATTDARTQARMLAEVWGADVDVAFGSAATPSVPDAVNALRERPGRRVAIASLLLGEGHFHDKLIASGADVVTAPLGTATQVVEQILTRFDGVG
ncbi:sirohydrochlorin chelatase [Dermacoccus profundi]|uniref:Sirohydrochlorin chelatase n=1 Tax=Dermacoccus profundi TaxID=322602 RepID=A0ABN2DIT1_9MICO